MSGSGDDYQYEEVKDCVRDESLDHSDPNNLFECKVDEECCTVDLEPACCAKLDIKDELLDQLEIWGPLLLVIFLLSLLIWWCRSDESCCDVEKPWLYRCGCKKRKPEDDLESQDNMSGSQLSLRSNKSGTTFVDGIGGHDAAELEMAVEHLGQKLEQEEQEHVDEDDGDDDDDSDDDHEDELETERHEDKDDGDVEGAD